MIRKTIDLVYFDGCPNAEVARQNIRSALEAAGVPPHWDEWDLASEDTPERYRRHGSPTVLVDGRDVTGDGTRAVAMACRSVGAPSVSTIAEAIGGRSPHGMP
jgi:hypothetical protein